MVTTCIARIDLVFLFYMIHTVFYLSVRAGIAVFYNKGKLKYPSLFSEYFGTTSARKMSLSGKVEGEVEIKAPAEKFREIFSGRPHHISNVSPEKIQGCALHEGDWGIEGSVIYWDYVHDGKAKVAKEIVEAIDEKNHSVTFKVVEGDLMEEYKSFKIVVQATPKSEGSVVHWTFEFEKLSADVPEPNTLLQFVLDVSKDIGSHLSQ